MSLTNTYDPLHREKNSGYGIGINNVIKRLEMHYPERYELTIDDYKEKHLYRCQLKIAIVKKMKTIIVDDEPSARKGMINSLAHHPGC